MCAFFQKYSLLVRIHTLAQHARNIFFLFLLLLLLSLHSISNHCSFILIAYWYWNVHGNECAYDQCTTNRVHATSCDLYMYDLRFADSCGSQWNGRKKLKNWNRKTHPNRLNSIVLFVAITDCYTVCSTAYLTRSQRQPHIWSLHKDHPDQTTRHHFRIVHLCKCILVSVLMFLHSFWIEREENTTHIQMNLIKLYSQEIEKRNRLSCRGYFTHWTFHGHIFRLVCLSVCVWVCTYLCIFHNNHFSSQAYSNRQLLGSSLVHIQQNHSERWQKKQKERTRKIIKNNIIVDDGYNNNSNYISKRAKTTNDVLYFSSHLKKSSEKFSFVCRSQNNKSKFMYIV